MFMKRKRKKLSRLKVRSARQQARLRTKDPLHLQSSTKMKMKLKKTSFRTLKIFNCNLTLPGITLAPVVARPVLLQ